MASERELFDLSGPLHLTTVDWKNTDHRRSVAASLVQGVYIQERDRLENRQGSHSLAPPWWKFFHFDLHTQLIDDSNSSIFGAIYKYQSPQRQSPNDQNPHYVIAFRGTSIKGESRSKDLQLNLHFILNRLHSTPRFQIAIQAVRNTAAAAANSAIWLAGHSLGSAMAMLAGKHMAKTGIFLEAFLFNPPFVSAPIEKIKDKKVRNGIRIASSFVTAGLAAVVKVKHQKKNQVDPFAALKEWVPCLFVNPCDQICAEYIGYFEHRKKMEEIGAGEIEKLATQHSIAGLVMSVIGKESDEPLHLIPSANLTVNLSPSREFKRDHGIHQWWRSDLNLQSKIYKYI